MPTKSKRKGRHKSKACPETESPVNKKIIDYFPPSPPPSNNNSSCTSLQFPSDTSIYNGTLPKDLTDSKDGVCTISCLPTPEDSPDKVDMPIKPEPPDGGGLSKPDFSEDAESYREPGLCASASSSHSANEDKVTGHSALQEKKSNSKRQARKPKSKPEEVKPNHLVTDFFPVRKSSRKTAKELQREHEDLIRCLILDECEDGLQVVNYEGKGRGVQATKPFKKGDFVVEYAGDLVELKEAKFREETYQKDISCGCYMYFFSHRGKSYCIDATRESGKYGRLLNHSRTKPNCVTKTVEIAEKAYLILVAARDIAVGEELVYDYGDRSKEAIQNNPWLKE